MKKLKKLIYLLALAIPATILMAFNPLANYNNLTNEENELLPEALPTSASLWVGWKAVDVTYRTSGNYVVRYSDIVTIDPGHTITWGCGYLDLDPSTSGFQCSVTRPYYTATGANGCAYIYVHSLATPEPGYSATHTIDVRVKDDQGIISNWGGITLIIHNTGNADNSEPVNPCMAF